MGGVPLYAEIPRRSRHRQITVSRVLGLKDLLTQVFPRSPVKGTKSRLIHALLTFFPSLRNRVLSKPNVTTLAFQFICTKIQVFASLQYLFSSVSKADFT